MKETRCDISARVRVWKSRVLLIIMGMILTWIRFLSVSYYGLLERFVYIVYVIYGVQSVVVCGVLIFYEL